MLSNLSTPLVAGIFVLAGIVVFLVSLRITRLADVIADRTGMGEALAGGLLLGAATSLSGLTVSATAAWSGDASLAIANGVGGIAAQTAFLAAADLAFRKANLEHAAASAQNMMQNALLIALLALILLAPTLPDFTFWHIHPVTPILFGVYVYGIHLIRGVREHPMWRPTRTAETRPDEPEDLDSVPGLLPLGLRFVLFMLLLGAAGWLMEGAAANIAQETFFSTVAVGVLFTAVATSLPELVTSIAAVRRGALTLAVGGIIGGNAYDTLFTAASDIAYRDGSIYHSMTDEVVFWTSLTLLMSAVLIMGLIRREKRGPGMIGVESVVLLLLYAFGVGLLLLMD